MILRNRAVNAAEKLEKSVAEVEGAKDISKKRPISSKYKGEGIFKTARRFF